MATTKAHEREATQGRLARLVESIATYVLTTADEWEEYHMYAGGERLRPSFFDGALPYLEGSNLLDDAGADRMFIDVTPHDLAGEINIAYITSPRTADREAEEGMNLDRVRQVTLAEARGKVRHYSRQMVEWANVWIPNVGDAEALRVICGSIGPNAQIGASLRKGTWGLAGVNHVWLPNLLDGAMPPKELISDVTHIINGGYALAFTARYDWHLRIGFENCPTLRFAVDERAVRDLFANRDIAIGQDRRAALKHWVNQHWRTNRLDEGETESLVRRYLRGESAFTWGGFTCALEPSRFDLEKNEELRAARKAMRKDQTRRPRRSR